MCKKLLVEFPHSPVGLSPYHQAGTRSPEYVAHLVKLTFVFFQCIEKTAPAEGIAVFVNVSTCGTGILEMGLVFGVWVISPEAAKAIVSPMPNPSDVTNTEALGLLLYTRYIYFFQAAGMVLLVAMVGAIVLTLRHKPNVKRQNIAEQVGRTPADSIEIVDIKPGQGL